jgi:hypothetical protein
MNISLLAKVVVVGAGLAGAGYKYAPQAAHYWPWHKSSAKVTTASAKAAPERKPGELGEITLTNHFETVVDLGSGKTCLMVTRMMDSRNLELTLSLEARNAGKTRELSVTQISAKPGKLMEVALGGMQLSFTPKLAD